MEEDPCVYQLKTQRGFVILGLCVDDILVVESDPGLCEQAMEMLWNEFELAKVSEKNFLNVRIIEIEGFIELSQEDYREKISRKYKLENCNQVQTPMDSQHDLDEGSPEADTQKYQEMLCSLM